MAKAGSMHMKSTAVINIAGLSWSVLNKIPSLLKFSNNYQANKIQPVFPALTCSAQSTYLTGLLPNKHGIVGNGWFFNELSQIFFWRQSNHLVAGEKVWEAARKLNPAFRCANLFWWYNMYSSADYSVTPRPIYRSNGLKFPDISTEPPELREILQRELGQFPLFQFWGPAANITSSRWIARASQMVFEKYKPNLSLIYLPHLDYCLQREGPNGPTVRKELIEIDRVCDELIQFFRSNQTQIIFLSEYGINPVNQAIPINRILRRKGWLRVRIECGEDHLDPGISDAFAVADHQIAHIYIQNPNLVRAVREELEKTQGIEKILDKSEQELMGVSHPRSGDLVLISKMDHWFSYKYWLDDKKAPDYAQTVDIHKKPGYDPVELFLNPKMTFPKLNVLRKIIRKNLGFRYLMNVIPLDDTLVKGSHGRQNIPLEYWPVFLSERVDIRSLKTPTLQGTQIKSIILQHVFE